MARSRTGCGVALILLLTTAPVQADDRVGLPGESVAAARRLQNARKLVTDKNWPEALDEYQRLLDPANDDLVPVGPNLLVQVRRLCHHDLAALPPEALRLYRSRVEAQARKWVEQAAAARDERLLRRVVDEAFCSEAGARALDLLGDLAFERGQFREAARWWRRLVLPASAKPVPDDLSLVYPAEPPVDVALVRAKQILAHLFLNERDSLAEELKAFDALHGQAEGQLAGRKGKYSALLHELANQPEPLALPPAADSWPTFAGSPSRNYVPICEATHLKNLLELGLQGPRWRFRLDTHPPVHTAGDKDERLPKRSSVEARRLAFYPVIAGNQVLTADARFVTAYDLATGKATDWYDLQAQNLGPASDLKLPARPNLCYTLTVAEGYVLARLGTQGLSDLPRDPETKKVKAQPQERDSYLVCLSLAPRRGSHFCWRAQPAPAMVVGEELPIFEGAPVVAQGRVYIAVTRFRGTESITAIHCYPLATDRDTDPLPLWRQDVCAFKDDRLGESRFRHQLLTVAGPYVVYASHAGSTVAVDALTGRRAWALRYASRGDPGPDQPSPRDLAPCVYASGRLFAAPADTNRLFCLDPDTGATIWERGGVEVVQLLGVGSGRVIFTQQLPAPPPETPRYALRAVDAADGGDRGGWYQPGDGGSLAPFGRGMLLGDLVFWPTVHGLYVLRQQDGQQPTDIDPVRWHRLRCGNMAFAAGCLAVADAEELFLYVAPGQLVR